MTYLVYPHQLFFDFYPTNARLVLVEEPLFFTQYRFHKQKLIFHRATMKAFAAARAAPADYVSFYELGSTEAIIEKLESLKIGACSWVDPDDDWLKSRVLAAALGRVKIELLRHPHFLTPESIIQGYAPKRNFYFFHDFYKSQRVRLNVLMEGRAPVGGKWSYDAENRLRLPADLTPPPLPKVSKDAHNDEAVLYVERHFKGNPGAGHGACYPCDRAGALSWMESFFQERYHHFGEFEDAISTTFTHNFHSVLTPFLNIGLLSPTELIKAAAEREVSLNSKEGFIRQVIGWREFVRLVYHREGRKQRTRNALKNTRNLPAAFYDGATGIEPVDTVIRRVLEGAYCHHIERLMILGNFMLLCEIDPDQVYQWFMEMFIDAYDWVMVPNVYGMSQYADGGLMTTKPYVSGSSYVLKMSDFKKGSWTPIWDALYWRFIDRHIELIRANPRLGVMAGMCEKLRASGKLAEHQRIADGYLARL